MSLIRLEWPDLTGAKTSDGALCLGIAKARSRSDKGKTRFEFLALRPITLADGSVLPEGSRITRAAHDVWWENSHKTQAILQEGLREIVNRKAPVPFDRGAVAVQVVSGTGGPRAYMYEVYRGVLWPRYWWPMPYSRDYGDTIKWLIWMETLSKSLVAIPDTRRSAQVEFHYPEEPRGLRFYTDDLRVWVRDVQEKYSEAVRKD